MTYGFSGLPMTPLRVSRPSGRFAFPSFAALLSVENALAQTKRDRRDLDELVALDEIHRLFQAQPQRRRKPDRDVRRRGANVRLLLLAHDVEWHVLRSRVQPDEHAFVYLRLRLH